MPASTRHANASQRAPTANQGGTSWRMWSSLPGLFIAMAVSYIYRSATIHHDTVTLHHDPVAATPSSPLPIPQWTDGFYTSDATHGQTVPSTHALLYPNGGTGTPVPLSFYSDSDFRSLGRLYNDAGQIVQSPSHFRNGTALYRGPLRAGTHFHWPAVYVGYKRPVPGLLGGSGKQVLLETLTDPSDSSPRVFYVHNFLSEEETQQLIDFSTSDTNPYKMAPSTGGTHKAWNQGGAGAKLTTRTSMNAFDITTDLSLQIKKRAFRLLRMGAFQPNLADGIQILRYELGQAYVAHHDYFPRRQSEDHSWDPVDGGSNRFATLFLYLSDVEVGGQTVFPKSDRLTAETSQELVQRLGTAPSREELRELQSEAGVKDGSWEDRLISQCFEKFAVPPRRGDAILFYSQKPNGELDENSLHGACPVLKGTKWGANLWVWNACRYSQCQHDPLHPAEELPRELKAPFDNEEVVSV